MANIYDMTDTWNNVATTFVAIKMNVTDTASAAGSLVFQLQVASSNVFTVTKNGAGTLLSNMQIGASSGYIFGGRSIIASPANGIIRLTNQAENDFTRLQLGGTTASFPALKRNATAVETKLADDSAYAPHAMQYLDVTDGVTAPGAATGRARIYVDTADGDLKIIFADGTIKTIVTDT